MPNFSEFSVTISVFLILYTAFLVLFSFYSIFNIYHLIRYGLYGFGLYLIITIFAGGTILLVAGSIFLLQEYDWSIPIQLNNIVKIYTSEIVPEGFFGRFEQ